MKTMKELLFFILPSVVIMVLLYSMIFVPSGNLPRFMGAQNYLRLFLNDKLLLRALFNSLALPLVLALFAGIVIYLVKNLCFKKACEPLHTSIYYACLFLASSLTFFLISNIMAILAVISACDLLTRKPIYAALPAFLISAQIGIVNCFLFWLVDKIKGKIGGIKSESKSD